MPLRGKYLKYSPEITLEIFTLVWDKLINLGWTDEDNTPLNKSFLFFSTTHNYLKGRYKKVFNQSRTKEGIETTVQEILGYDPFIEDDFILPDKWCIKTTKDENGKLIGKWFDKQSKCRCYYDTCLGEYYNSYNLLNESIILGGNLAASFASLNVKEGYTEITFDQFKKYVLKESIETPKETNSEYVECLENHDTQFTKGKIYKVINSEFNSIEVDLDDNGKPNGWHKKFFKPSTKEAFNAQNKPIEKWSVGSYVVFLKDNLQNNGRKKGDISKIKNLITNAIDFEDSKGNNIDGEFSVVTDLKWFATKTEAEEFAKTLVEPVKHGNGIINIIELKEFPKEGYCKTDRIELRYYLKNKFPQYIQKSWQPKYTIVAWNETGYWWCEEKSSKPEYQLSQLEKFFIKEDSKKPLKQAVHCTTQEEWDFANDIHQSSLKADFKDFKDKTVLRLDFKNAYADVLWAETNGYQILSFQEWCDLNGYKMEKEVKFEVGKWYKLNNWISKFNYLEGDYKFYGENINTSTGFVDKFGWMDLNEYTPIEISIEEIQQYLSDDHPDKIKPNKNFQDGDWVFAIGNIRDYDQPTIGKINKFSIGDDYDSKVNFYNKSGSYCTIWSNVIRHATPEEIYNHSRFIGQTQSEKYPFKKLEEDDLTWEIKTEDIRWIEPVSMTKDNWKHEMLLSVNDEEFPMVNIIKTNTIKQLLNND